MVQHLLSHHIAALFVDMGLGKTRAVLKAIEDLVVEGSARGALIVAPLRVATLTWPNEAARWCPWMKVADLRTKQGMKAWHEGTATLYVINYEMLQTFSKEIGKHPPADIVVWDEISKCKSHASKRVKAFMPHRDKFTFHWGMTGTPICNSYADIFAPVRLLDGGERLGRSYHAFLNRYFDSDYMGWTHTIKPWAKPAIEEKIADITLTLKADEYLDIPPVTVEDVDVVLPSPIMSDYRKLQKDFLLQLKNDKEIVGVNAAALVGKLQQFTSGAIYDEERNVNVIHDAKLKALENLAHGEPMLVATSFIHERERILQWFPEAKAWREDSLDRWNAGKIPMLVVDPRSVSMGLNLQHGGRHIVWFTQTYSREMYDQFNARLARTGQTKEVVINRLLCPNTIDWAVVEALEHKGNEQSGLKEALKALQKI